MMRLLWEKKKQVERHKEISFSVGALDGAVEAGSPNAQSPWQRAIKLFFKKKTGV